MNSLHDEMPVVGSPGTGVHNGHAPLNFFVDNIHLERISINYNTTLTVLSEHPVVLLLLV